ncbi:K02A2.6-like [Cordylochernes scorpioides]|uniref:RNA-directed DNA polymerase n=1 Tax=Cordylochernes scorpioides TaxID=51811 RepID=A0ABY6LCY5_9ARAC|nr:K02A2.6-like [Cordylochernes scorpioides]
MVRTKQRLRESYWWPGIDKDVEDLVTNCWVFGPFIDTEIGFRFAITLIDYTSKWPEVFCTKKTTSKVIINFLEDVFSREGFPREIVTDNGTPFISEEFEDFLRSNGIKHIRTANYHPACNGEVENFNKTLKSTVLTAHLQHTEVKRTIQLFLREYRSSTHTVTKKTPSAVLHGRTLRTLVHVFDKEVKTKPPEEACRQEDKSDSESKSCSPKLQVGDQVKVQAGDPVMKGRSKLRGPFTITKQLRPFTFVLSDGSTKPHSHPTEPASRRFLLVPGDDIASGSLKIEGVRVRDLKGPALSLTTRLTRRTGELASGGEKRWERASGEGLEGSRGVARHMLEILCLATVPISQYLRRWMPVVDVSPTSLAFHPSVADSSRAMQRTSLCGWPCTPCLIRGIWRQGKYGVCIPAAPPTCRWPIATGPAAPSVFSSERRSPSSGGRRTCSPGSLRWAFKTTPSSCSLRRSMRSTFSS